MIARRTFLAVAAASLQPAPPVSSMPSAPPSASLRGPLERIVASGAPGALVTVRTSRGYSWAAAGVADIRGGRTPLPTDRFRIASITKTFVATVLLQLVAEGLIGLDDPIERYLPGLLPCGGIRIRQLLQHTSGLRDYHDYDGLDSAAAFLAHRYDDPPARQSIALAAAHGLLFQPGTGWSYADTNYLILGLLVEEVCSSPTAVQVFRRLIDPLQLTATSFPCHTPLIHGPHLRGYMPADTSSVPFADLSHPIDFTDETVDQTGAAGAMTSTGPDLQRFLSVLLRGELLPPRLMHEMTRTVPTGAAGAAAGLTGYGLGLAQFTDPLCGTSFWGNTGSIHGYTTAALATRDGSRQMAAVVTLNPCPDPISAEIIATLGAIACGMNRTGSTLVN